MNKKVLVIDDDPALITLLELGLKRDGFEVLTASNGKEGVKHAYEARPDVIVLDIMMPEMDGWETCQRIRNICDTPILMLTAKTTQSDILKGLSLGADDYITKPCSFEELKARIYTVLRRVPSQPEQNWRTTYDDGTLNIDLAEETIKKNGELLELTPTEQRLLMYLVSNKGRVVPHQELLVSVWGTEYTKEVGYLSVYVRYLRQKIEDDPGNPRYIRTRWGMGYYFAGDNATPLN